MKPTWTIFLFFATQYFIYSQPVITENSFINIDQSECIRFFEFDGVTFDPGSAGANQNWDFTNIPISNDTCFYEILDPATSVFRDSFPLSNVHFICTTEDSDGEKVENHTFYINSPEEVALEGNVSISISDPDFDSIFIVYHNPQINFSFPYNFETEHEDDWSAVITNYIPGQAPLVVFQVGTIVTKADAYGKVTTAAGEFPNTMRIYRFEDAENTIPGVPFSSSQETHRYTWMSDDETYLILNLDQTIIRDFNGNVVSQTNSGFFRKRGPGGTVSQVSPYTDVAEINLFPNPAEYATQLLLSLKESLEINVSILTIGGKIVWDFKLDKLSSGNHSIDIDVSNLSRGTYFVQLSAAGKMISPSLPLTILK